MVLLFKFVFMGNYWATQPKPKYGWKRPANPHKNRLKLLQVKEDLPSTFDLTAKMPVPYDQGSLGSYTANATAAAFQVIINNSGIVDKSSRSQIGRAHV